MNYALRVAARLAGVTEHHVRYLVRVGRLQAERSAGRLELPFAELARLKAWAAGRDRAGEDAGAQLPLALDWPAAAVVPLRPAAAAAELLEPHSIDELRELAYELEATQLERALSLHREIARATDDPDDWAALLAVLCENERCAQAVALARTLRQRFRATAGVQFNCGVAFHRERMYRDAATAYAAALRIDCDYVDAHRYLFECYGALGQMQLAIQHGNAWRRLSGD